MCTRAVGGLAHYLEEEGVATTQISLIREHTEVIKPPRALWVPFELGRPLGVPNDKDFQSRVLISVLNLFEAEKGPVLEDFSEDAPAAYGDTGPWACPVDFERPEKDLGELEKLRSALKGEIDQIRPWYGLAVKERGSTTVGASDVVLDHLADFITAFLDDTLPENPNPEVPLPVQLSLAANDLKAYYTEAVTVQPNRVRPGSNDLADWLWGETAAGEILLCIRDVCGESGDEFLKRVARGQIVPGSQGHRRSSMGKSRQ